MVQFRPVKGAPLPRPSLELWNQPVKVTFGRAEFKVSPLTGFVLLSKYSSPRLVREDDAHDVDISALNDLRGYLEAPVHERFRISGEGWSVLTPACVRQKDDRRDMCMQFVYDYFFLTPRLYWYKDIIAESQPTQMRGVPMNFANNEVELVDGNALELALKSENLELFFLVLPAFCHAIGQTGAYEIIAKYIRGWEEERDMRLGVGDPDEVFHQRTVFVERLKALYRIFRDALEQYHHLLGQPGAEDIDGMGGFGETIQESEVARSSAGHAGVALREVLIEDLKKLIGAIFTAKSNISYLNSDDLRNNLINIPDSGERQANFVQFLRSGDKVNQEMCTEAREAISSQFSSENLIPGLDQEASVLKFLLFYCASLRALLAWYMAVPDGRLFSALRLFLEENHSLKVSLIGGESPVTYWPKETLISAKGVSEHHLPFFPREALMGLGRDDNFDLNQLRDSLSDTKLYSISSTAPLFRQVIVPLANRMKTRDEREAAVQRRAMDLVMTARMRFLSHENIFYLRKVYEGMRTTKVQEIAQEYRRARMEFEQYYSLPVFSKQAIPLISVATLLGDVPFVRRLACFYRDQMSAGNVLATLFDNYGCSALFISVLLRRDLDLDLFCVLLPVLGRATNCLGVSCLDFALAASDYGAGVPSEEDESDYSDISQDGRVLPLDGWIQRRRSLRVEEENQCGVALSLSDPYIQSLMAVEWNLVGWTRDSQAAQ